jgi:hypothetical protein
LFRRIFEIREEALDGFVESNSMLPQLVPLEIILEVRRREPPPVHHALFLKHHVILDPHRRRYNYNET